MAASFRRQKNAADGYMSPEVPFLYEGKEVSPVLQVAPVR
jgi:hypothetical protein